LEEAGAILEHALAAPVGNPVTDGVRHPGGAAFVAALSGELARARHLAASAVAAADRLGLASHDPGRVLAGLALVELHLERDEPESAVRVLDEVKQASDASHRLPLQSMVALHEAKVARVLGDELSADGQLTLTRLFFAEPDEAFRQVLAEEAVAQALRFDPSKAGPLIEALEQDRVATHVLRARLALLEYDDRTAADLLGELPPPRTRRTRVERDVLYALSMLERDVELANRHLGEALAAAQPEHLIRTFIEHGPRIPKLLSAFAPDGNQQHFVEMLLTAASHAVAPRRTATASALVEPLSSREVTVLRYLCSRLTYREIAAALYVSVNTLKSHVRSIYRKLDASSRADAVQSGRRLGLI
jgi:LuxR family maltose regulon positive regulatory protein